MIAYALRETGNDPAWIVGGVIPQLGGNAGGGDGWLVVEGDESDRSVFELRPKLAVVTNVELDHHAAYGSVEELSDALDAWLATVPDTVRGWVSIRWTSRSTCPAHTTASMRPVRSRRFSGSGSTETRPKPRSRPSPAPSAASRWSE